MAQVLKKTDVCVIGGAGAGLTAALRAREQGAEVLLIDKMKLFGGCSRMCGGMFALGTSIQKKQGCDEDIDVLYKQHMERSNWNVDAKLVRRWYTELPDVCSWLEDHKVTFTEAAAFSGVRKTYVRFYGGGNYLINTLVEECRSLGVEMMNHTRAVQLIQDANGNITGVIATQGENVLVIEAKSVVIATGSVANNKELLDRLYPRKNYFNVKRMSGVPHNTGDGFLMAEKAGAMQGDMGILFIGPQNHGSNVQVGNLMRRPMLVEVNARGERFTNEDLPLTDDWGWSRAVSQDREKDHLCYCLMDDSIFRRMLANPENMTAYEAGQGQAKTANIVDRYGKDITRIIDTSSTEWINHLEEAFPAEVAKGKMAVVNTLEEAAEWIGCSSDVLKDTIEQYNQYCKAGKDDDFLKEPKYLWPLTTAPYYVFRGEQGIDTCIGGIQIDRNLHVLNKEYDIIPNLYAAGVCSSGWFNNFYGYFGACLSLSVFSGYAAGIEAAKNAVK